MRVIVTGGAGFIGSNLVDYLLGCGQEVAVFDNLSTGRVENVDGRAYIYRGDVRDARKLRMALIDFAPDAVAHLAAQIDVRKSVADPAADAGVNVIGTINVGAECKAAGVGRVVFASSGGAIYGDTEFAAVEGLPEQPVSPYGVAKLAGEHYLRCQHLDDGPAWCALRLANVYGPRQDPHGEAGVVAIFSGLLCSGLKCTIFGDGEQTRDYTYVVDVCRAFAAALESEFVGCANIGTGVETTLHDLYWQIAKACKTRRSPKTASAKPGEQRRSWLDYSLARRELGWEPEVWLETGVQSTVAWFKEHREAP